jgi:sugar/nucleoside kinase (ribokinase family)
VVALAASVRGGGLSTSILDAGRQLNALGPTVVVKCGADGALLVDNHHAVRAFLGAGAPVVVDTVGAGDAFDAGFIAGILDDLAPADALRLAVATGTLSTQARGGIDGQPDLPAARLLASSVLVHDVEE